MLAGEECDALLPAELEPAELGYANLEAEPHEYTDLSTIEHAVANVFEEILEAGQQLYAALYPDQTPHYADLSHDACHLPDLNATLEHAATNYAFDAREPEQQQGVWL